jgi:hypothetical protein
MSALERRQTKRSLTSIVSSAPPRGRETRLAAVGFAFRSAGGFDVVAETLDEAEPFGSELLADAVATVLRTAARYADAHVEFDGHLTDPHLQPVVDRIPHLTANPIDLIEIQ